MTTARKCLAIAKILANPTPVHRSALAGRYLADRAFRLDAVGFGATMWTFADGSHLIATDANVYAREAVSLTRIHKDSL